MEIYASMEAFVFTMDGLGSTRRPTIVKKLAVIVLQCIMTPSFVSLEMFSLVTSYLFSILFVTIITD